MIPIGFLSMPIYFCGVGMIQFYAPLSFVYSFKMPESSSIMMIPRITARTVI